MKPELSNSIPNQEPIPANLIEELPESNGDITRLFEKIFVLTLRQYIDFLRNPEYADKNSSELTHFLLLANAANDENELYSFARGVREKNGLLGWSLEQFQKDLETCKRGAKHHYIRMYENALKLSRGEEIDEG